MSQGFSGNSKFPFRMETSGTELHENLLRKVETASINAFNSVKMQYAFHFMDLNETRSFLTTFRGDYL